MEDPMIGSIRHAKPGQQTGFGSASLSANAARVDGRMQIVGDYNPNAQEQLNNSEIASRDWAGLDEFIPSARFAGQKVGYSYKQGDKGMGYYLDNTQYEARSS